MEDIKVDEDGNVAFPKLYKNYKVQTVIIKLPYPMWFSDIVERCAPALPYKTGFKWFKSRIRFDPVPDKLIKDVTAEMKEGD